MPRHFFIAGAQRCATTYLYRMLDQHPDICMAQPMRPEPKYFLQDHAHDDDGVAAYRRACFARPDARWLGEKSTSYIERPDAARRIARLLPDAMIVFVLRDPVERALSNYRFSVLHGHESLPLRDALEAEPARVRAGCTPATSVSPHAYVGRGHYARQLDAWATRFPARQLHIVTTEQLVDPSAGALAGIFAALELRPDIALQGVGEAVNETRALDAPSDVRERLRDAFAQSNRDLARRYGVEIGAWT